VSDVAHAVRELSLVRLSLLVSSVSGYKNMAEDMRRNQHLITDDVMKYMAEYDVRRSLLWSDKHSSYRRLAGTPT
jgi:hypothetical protein